MDSHPLVTVDRRTTDRRRSWCADVKGSEKGGPCWKCQNALSRAYGGEGTLRYRECARVGCGARWATREAFVRRLT